MSKKPAKKKADVSKLTHDTVPASVGLVKEVRDELRTDIQSVRHELRSVEHRLDSKIELLRSEVKQIGVSAHRTQVLMEEQRSENKIVLDGLKTYIDRQNRVEADVAELRHDFTTLKSAIQP